MLQTPFIESVTTLLSKTPKGTQPQSSKLSGTLSEPSTSKTQDVCSSSTPKTSRENLQYGERREIILRSIVNTWAIVQKINSEIAQQAQPGQLIMLDPEVLTRIVIVRAIAEVLKEPEFEGTARSNLEEVTEKYFEEAYRYLETGAFGQMGVHI